MFEITENFEDMSIQEQQLYQALGGQCRWLEAVEIAQSHGFTPYGLNWVIGRHPELFREEEFGDVIVCRYAV